MGGQQPDSCRLRPARLVAWILAVAAIMLLLYYFVDDPAVRIFEPYHHQLPAWVGIPSDVARQYGQGPVILAAVAMMIILDPRQRREAVKVVIAVLIAVLAVQVLKLSTGRARPDEFLTGAPAFKLFEGFLNKEYVSFPSAHAASAFAFSAALALVYRKWGWVFYTLAALCSASRVVDIQHFPSDVAGGAALGLWAGYGTLRWRWPSALAARIVPSRCVPEGGGCVQVDPISDGACLTRPSSSKPKEVRDVS